MNDPSKEVIELYFEKGLFELFPESQKEERKPFINHIIQTLGTQFVDAQHVIEILGIKEFNTPEMAKQEALSQVMMPCIGH